MECYEEALKVEHEAELAEEVAADAVKETADEMEEIDGVHDWADKFAAAAREDLDSI